MKCYCAFCKSTRYVYTKRRISLFNVAGAMFATCVASLAIWRGFDPRAILILVAFLAMAECFVQIRWRLNIVCKECGFDPVVYLKDPDRAADKVKARLERRKADPASLFKAALDLPKVAKPKPTLEKPKGQLVSKSV